MPTAPPTTDRPAYRPYRAAVSHVTRLSPSFVRVGFTGDDLEHFAEHALDQRVKLVFPLSNECFAHLGVDDEDSIVRGEWYDRWRALPEAHRPPFRTYTVRTIDSVRRRLEIDFVAHHEPGAAAGPGSAWLASAAPGAEAIVVGPDARSAQSHIGMDWKPGTARELLLLGDETAAPAIAGILEQLPQGRQATAFIEVPTAADTLEITTPAGCHVHYLAREGAAIGSLLEPALRAWTEQHTDVVQRASAPRPQLVEEVDVDRETLWDSPEASTDGGFYAWIAGESAVIKRLRRMLVTELGVDRRRVAFMGYWRQGQAERTG